MKIAICNIGKEDSGELLPLLLFERARSCVKRGCSILAVAVDGAVKEASLAHLQRICDQGGLACVVADSASKIILKPRKSRMAFSKTAIFLNDIAPLSNQTWLCLNKGSIPPFGDAFLIDGGCFCYRDGKLLCSVLGSGRLLIKACA